MTRKEIQAKLDEAFFLAEIKSWQDALASLVLLTTTGLPLLTYMGLEFYRMRDPILLVPLAFFLCWSKRLAFNLIRFGYKSLAGDRFDRG